jgi:SAM-dependent methyltransferase
MHSDQLTIDEHNAHPVHREFMKRIDYLRKPDLKVLDWGCGRGSDVLHLRRKGINAYGAEISEETIKRGKSLFEEFGLDQSVIVKVIRTNNKTDFPNSFFDVLISYYVLEHVEDLYSAVLEMFRIMKPGGIGIHLYPAHLHFVEDHLSMPFVHWLPKDHRRHNAIKLFTSIGIEPKWEELSHMSIREKADRYFDFSSKETFYRTPREVVKTFKKVGFRSTFESHKHDRIVQSGLDKIIPKPILSGLLNRFVGCILVIRK